MERKNVNKRLTDAGGWRGGATEANPLRRIDLSRLGIVARFWIGGADRQRQLHLKLLLQINEIQTILSGWPISAAANRFSGSDSLRRRRRRNRLCSRRRVSRGRRVGTSLGEPLVAMATADVEPPQ